MEVPRLGVQLELQVYAAATATLDPSLICNLHRSLQQCQILNSLSKATDRTHILMDTSRVLNPRNHNGNSQSSLLINLRRRWGRWARQDGGLGGTQFFPPVPVILAMGARVTHPGWNSEDPQDGTR